MSQTVLSSLANDFREGDSLSPHRMSKRLAIPLAEFARLAGLDRNMLSCPTSSAVQARLVPITHILEQAETLTGDTDRAILWFRQQPIPGHDGRTARDLVEDNNGGAVVAYLEELRDGAYA